MPLPELPQGESARTGHSRYGSRRLTGRLGASAYVLGRLGQPLIERTVALCTRRPWLVIAVAFALVLSGLYVAVTRFAINTNTERLISENVAWRQALKAYAQVFPKTKDLIVAVVDGQTPEIADEAADKLARALAAN